MVREALDLLLLNPVEPGDPALRTVAEMHGRPDWIGLDKNDYAEFTSCLLAAVDAATSSLVRGYPAEAVVLGAAS